MVKFEDDKFDHKESDIEKIQTSTGMYIGYKGQKGALHLAKELYNNCVDELTNENTVGKNISVFFDVKTNNFIISDDGRGIPFEHLEKVCTTLQSGTKLTREGAAGSGAGQNGTGLTATNALSDIFELTSKRYGKMKTLRFEKGIKVSETEKKCKPDEHGLTVSFIPSLKYLANHGEDCQIQHEDLLEWIETTVHLVPPGITTKVQIRLSDDKMINKKLTNKDGILGILKKTIDKPILEPFVIKDLYKFKEIDREGKELDRYIGLEAAITFVSDSNGLQVNSFCNYVHTFDGGTHVDSVVNSAVRFFMREAKSKMSERDLKKYELKRIDIINSMAVCINVVTNTQPDFSGQVKEKVNSNIFTKVFNELGMVFRNLQEYFVANPKQLDKAVDIIKANAKARVKASEVKATEFKKSKTINLDLLKSKKFIQGSVRNKNQYKELLIVEGESASGGISSKGFTFQDAALLKGVPINAMKNSKVKVLDNDEMKLITMAMRAGFGNSFKLEEAWYDKIIIMSDGDSDGNIIFSSLCAFLMLYFEPYVRAGKVYRVLPPLYKINDKKRKFIKNKSEYFDVYVERIGDNIIIIDEEGEQFSAKKLRNFFYANRDYLDELRDLSKYFGVHPFIIEFICKHWGSKDFEKKLSKRFPEMVVNEDTVEGVYNGAYQYIIINKRFRKNARKFIEVLTNEMNTQDLYRVKRKYSGGYEDLGDMSIGEILTLCEPQFAPSIIQRYKGLGEISHTEFRETVLDPRNRQLIRLTISDFEEAMERMRILHDGGTKYTEKRKELISSYSIRKDELDN